MDLFYFIFRRKLILSIFCSTMRVCESEESDEVRVVCLDR